MNIDTLDFEQPIVELDQKIDELKRIGSAEGVSLSEELVRLKEKSLALTESIFSNLTAILNLRLCFGPVEEINL